MGGGSSQSSGSNSFQSNPVNLQYPAYQALSGPVADYLTRALNTAGPSGVNSPNSGYYSPYYGNAGGTPVNYGNYSGGVGSNPLVAPLTGAQWNLLSGVANTSATYNPYNQQALNAGANASNYAQSN